MEERFTIKIDPATSADRLSELAAVLSETFFLSQEEAEALLQADTLVLKRAEALALARLCRRTGVDMSMSAPLLTSAVQVRRWLKRFTMPVLFSLSSALALVLLLILIVPDKQPEPETPTAGVSLPATLPEIPSANQGTGPAVDPSSGNEIGLTAPGDDAQAAQPEGEDRADGTLPIISIGEPLSETQSPTDEGLADTSTDDPATGAESLSVEDPSVTPQESESSPETPDLFTAARDLGSSAFEKALLASPTVDLRDAYGQTPLMYAAGHNTAEVVRLLLEAGSDPNARTGAGWTPLMYAARNTEGRGISAYLLAAGADPAARNDSGQSARDIALAYNNEEVVSSLNAQRVTTATPQNVQPSATRSADASSNLSQQPPATPSVIVPAAPATPVTATPTTPRDTQAIRAVPTGTTVSATPAPAPTVITSEASPTAAPPPDPEPNIDSRLELIPNEPLPTADEDAENRSLILECLANWDACATN